MEGIYFLTRDASNLKEEKNPIKSMMINSQCPPTHKNITGFTQDGLQTTIFSCSAQLKSRLARNCILHSVPRFLRIHTTSGQNTFAFFCIYSKRYLLSRLRKNLRLFLLCKGARLRDWRKNCCEKMEFLLIRYDPIRNRRTDSS